PTTDHNAALTTAAVNVILNVVPTVSFTAPANNAFFTPGSNITLTAAAADSDGSIAKVDFFLGATLIGTATAAPYSVVWSNVPADNTSRRQARPTTRARSPPPRVFSR